MALPQVRRVWPRRIQNMEDVPEAFKPYFEDQSGEFPYVIFDPAERAFATRMHAKLVCVLNREVRIYEKEKSQVKETRVKVEDVNYIEFGTILLYSWITIYLSGGANLKLIFNNTAEPLYKPVIDLFRNAPAEEATSRKTEEEKDKFDFLITQNFKFMNFGRKSIEPGEEIRRILYQPEIRIPYLKLFGKTFYKTLLKTSLVVLTDTELILIREPENTKTDIAGVKWFFPLDKIKDMHTGYSADLKKSALEIEFYDGNMLSVELELSKFEEAKGITECLDMQNGVLTGA